MVIKGVFSILKNSWKICLNDVFHLNSRHFSPPILLQPMYCVLCLVTQLYLTLWDPVDHNPPGSSVHGDPPGKNTGVGCHALLQGIFPTQESNQSLLHCRQILDSLSHQGSPWILQWIAYLFSRGSSQPRDWTQSLALQVSSLPVELPGKPHSQGDLILRGRGNWILRNIASNI